MVNSGCGRHKSSHLSGTYLQFSQIAYFIWISKIISAFQLECSDTIYTIQTLAKCCGMPYAMCSDPIRWYWQSLCFSRILRELRHTISTAECGGLQVLSDSIYKNGFPIFEKHSTNVFSKRNFEKYLLKGQFKDGVICHVFGDYCVNQAAIGAKKKEFNTRFDRL
jgi:hypothetical protein